jgi:hypothetical protein
MFLLLTDWYEDEHRQVPITKHGENGRLMLAGSKNGDKSMLVFCFFNNRMQYLILLTLSLECL